MELKFNNKVVYQIYPKSFNDTNEDGIGDINGIIEKLDYIQSLGVDYIWITPVTKSPQQDNGYDVSDYYDIDPIFGTLEDYKNLIIFAKEKNIKIMHDLVLNHCSTEHEWFQKAINGDKYYQEFFVWRDEPNAITSCWDDSAWEYVPSVGKYYLHCFDKLQADLNWDNPHVRLEMQKIVNFWIEFGVEAFRLDVIDMIGKDVDKMITSKAPNFYKYLKELGENTFKDELLVVGECWGSSMEDAYKMTQSNMLTQIFHFHNVFCVDQWGPTKWEQGNFEPIKLAKVIHEWQNNFTGLNAWAMNNHDLPRLISLWGNDERYRYECATSYATIFSLLAGVQYIYQGEEIGLINPNFENIDQYLDAESKYMYQKTKDISLIKRLGRDNARTTMHWDNSINNGFSKVNPWMTQNVRAQHISVASDITSDKSVYKFYQELIIIKKKYKNIINSKFTNVIFENNILILERPGLNIIINLSDKEEDFISINGDVILSNYSQTNKIKPYQAIIYKTRKEENYDFN